MEGKEERRGRGKERNLWRKKESERNKRKNER